MISLAEALVLTNTMGDDVISIRKYPVCTRSGKIIATREKIEEVFDTISVRVHWIGPRFVCGDYEGFEFAVSGVEIKDYSTTVL